MFRRKEETALDPSSSSAAAPNAQTGSSYADSNGASPAQSPLPGAPSGAQAAGNTYVPTAPITRTSSAAEPARSSVPASNYRPTPIAEFNRGAVRGAADALRSPGSASSFSATGEKSNVGKANRRVLTVGNDILLKGEIATCDRLVIEGRVEAKLSEVHTVEIAEAGSFKGTAEVEDAEISGVFEGDLIVRNRLVIYASGEVRGNISYGEIEIERGGRLTGQIKTVTGGAQGAKGKPFENAPDKRKETAAA
jgi:cytoskeletal protein CcmA (bactofilin family)